VLLALPLVGCGETLSSWRAPDAPRPRSVVVLPFRGALWEFYVEDNQLGVSDPFSMESTAGCRRGLKESGVVVIGLKVDQIVIETDPVRAAAVARSLGADAAVVGSLFTHKFSQTAEAKLVRASDGAVMATGRTNGGKGADGLARDACAALVAPASAPDAPGPKPP
jgi:hypothetical protein